MKMNIRKIISVSCVIMICIAVLSSCKNVEESSSIEQSNDISNTYAFIGKDIQNSYMQALYEGFETACSENGVKAMFNSPGIATAEKQMEIIEALVEQDVLGIAISANDEDNLSDAIKKAMDKGIKVISVDSAVKKDLRQTHIQQADPETIGRELIRSAYKIVDGNGGIAILSSTKQASNQNLWIEYMNKEISENQDKYANMPIVTVAYGDDDFTKSVVETEALLKNPNVKVIVSPTTIGMRAAAQVLEENNSDVKLTGLGLPSQMAPYIEDGICPVMYLWNPVDVGYLAGYTLDAIVKGDASGNVGDSFNAGRLGSKTISVDSEGGSEVILGDLLKFDANNISQWKDIY